MFETVSPETFIRRDRRLLYETLPLSIAVHVLAVGSYIGSTFMHATFPGEPPHLAFAYRFASEPPPPPPPPSPRPAQPIEQVKVELPPDKIVAPTVIPDTIPVLEPVPVAAAEISPVSPPGPGDAGPAADRGDTKEGVAGGTPGGQPRGVLGGLLLEDGRVHFARDLPLPLWVVRQEYPAYPEDARRHGYEDSVTVRYTIDKRGRVKELTVLDHAEREVFEVAALDAIKEWRFRPLVVDGEVLEAVHELTVFFRLK